ncbi:MAG: hypothetical protein ABL908_00685 [Hyphomicrobium sp.]
MKLAMMVAMAIALGAGSAMADDKPSAAEAEKIAATAKAWGCSGGEAEKETESSGIYEVDDAKCADGKKYDLKMDKDFKMISITAD